VQRDSVKICTNSAEETFRLGKRFAELLQEGDVVALTGNLGTGKTVFAQGICAGLEVEDVVTSPSFTLIQEYRGRLPVFHFDFYRLDSLSEIEDLDMDCYFNARGISIIEWAEKGEVLLPVHRFSIVLRRMNTKRKIATGKRWIQCGGPRGRGLLDLKL